MYNDIMKYIPYGKENAISRDDLAIKVGCSDRIMRDLISKARKKTVIINIQNGSGYYRPTEDLYEDAYDDISDGEIKRLQAILDHWAKTCGVSTTYYESHKYKVRIPWEDYDKRKGKE